MITEQNYVGGGTNANPNEQAVSKPGRTETTADERLKMPSSADHQPGQSTASQSLLSNTSQNDFLANSRTDITLEVSMLPCLSGDNEAEIICHALEAYRSRVLKDLLTSFGQGDDADSAVHMDELEVIFSLQTRLLFTISRHDQNLSERLYQLTYGRSSASQKAERNKHALDQFIQTYRLKA